MTAAIDAQRTTFEALGCIVEEGSPDFSDADEIFKLWRAWRFDSRYGALLQTQRHLMKDTVIWNIEAGEHITGLQLARAEIQRTALYHRVREFMETYEFMICPVSQVPPFDVQQPYITEINGVQMETYIDWMRSCYFVTVTGLPAISVPCGFTSEGLPCWCANRRTPSGRSSAYCNWHMPSRRRRSSGSTDHQWWALRTARCPFHIF